MRVLIVAALLAAGLPGTQACAQAAPDAASQPGPFAERFFQTLKTGKVREALATLGTTSPMMAKKIADDPSLSPQIEIALAAYGPVADWEKVNSEMLGTMVRRDTYILRHQNAVTRWRFIYEHVGTGWVVAHFAFEDQAQTWFK